MPLDLTSDPATWKIPASVEVVVNCGAVTGAACKRSVAESRKVNVDAVVALANICARESRMFVHISTNRVFSGHAPRMHAESEFAPLCEYGKQKAEADRQLLSTAEQGGHIAIVRLTKVVSQTASLFGAWRESLRNGESISAFTDLTMAPVSLPFVIEALRKIVVERRAGVFQVSAEVDVSYAKFAGDLADACRVPRELVMPVSIASRGVDLEQATPFTSLDVQRLRSDLRMTPPTPAEIAAWVAAFPNAPAPPMTRAASSLCNMIVKPLAESTRSAVPPPHMAPIASPRSAVHKD